MTGQRFDDLTRTLGRSSSRRSILKALAGTALGGLLMRGERHAASAAVKRRACKRLHESCSASEKCCPGGNDGTCNNGVCCIVSNAKCINDTDCCGSPIEVCRPAQPGNLFQVCLPAALLGEACANDLDCSGELVCDPYTDTCQEACGAFLEPCESTAECCEPLVCGSPPEPVGQITAQQNGFVCRDCYVGGASCEFDDQCCSGACEIYSFTCLFL